MIPEDKQIAVKNALQAAFGVSTYEDIRKLSTGLSNALVLRVVVQGKPFLLKIARTDFLSDPTLYYYTCMKSAAEAGIAPKVWYTSVEDGISITDFVELKPFPIAEAKNKLAKVLSTLHSLSPFSKTIHSLDTMNRFAQKFRETKILPEHMTEELLRSLERITYVYPRSKEDLVPSHNDLKPENILYDGNKAWLSDWEAAFTNDRYSDLSIVANFIVTDEAGEEEFLAGYFGRDVTKYELARFYLMRQIMHMSYFTVFMLVVAATRKQIDINVIPKHEFRDFHSRMWAGEINLAFDERRLEYALVHLEQLRQNLRTKRFEESLRIVSNNKMK
jgi:thiamine kinase-like enzyme